MNATGGDQANRPLAPTDSVDYLSQTLEELTMDFHATTAVLDGEKCAVQFVPGLKLGFTHSSGSAPLNAGWNVVSNVTRDAHTMKVQVAQELVTAGFFLGDTCTLPLAP